ncbi:SNF2-related protein [Epilithonimonas ginsengisoli]|uniref:SNF2-related protein n=1 Tax=Epilithonimonas ginsengisoli TaxID=1245592 RepID=A0ABU4JN03_9FLAO|nr:MULTISPECIES: SNF2-related protein [Chryseobacterium group]MBV6881941.1 DEAD/DEAH box helicase family protein [Epilithonimonas sp. FP105]MDW8551030.1 SNF2-related protein [Epilithonimonas ginsengisoli]OAH69933.1 DEAD/DEAH box helicase [Chryseobacterium sp. FP211-J200]
MSFTPYHAKYFSFDLTRQLPANDLGKFTASLQDAQVDLNPHQIDAALFAFQSPLSKGAILADEVGLGKTIEAGIILSQQWAERKRKLLIIAPANLRKQWNQEMMDKFYLPSVILESKSFNEEIKKGNLNPFNQNENIVICSFQFAKSKAPYLEQTKWDLVIVDEAHRLRNVYKPSNKTSNAIKEALFPYKKVLLTATPLQNSILELYGLVSIIDDYVFGDLKSFKSQYGRMVDDGYFQELKNRIQPICHRTLRRQVLEYINYTERIAIREEFEPNPDEYRLYDLVSEYLQRPKLYALPNSQRQLMTLILRKLLASSSYAIYGTLDALVKKLEGIVLKHNNVNLIEELDFDYETTDELAEEWDEDEENDFEEDTYSEEDIENMLEEIADLKEFRQLAKSIRKNSKADHLLNALSKGFTELEKLGANKKALIFTESRRTQEFLHNILEAQGYKGKVVLFNGTNTDTKSKEIYKKWLQENKGTDKVTGSPTADKRAALVEYFKNEGTIMIATEAAAEGINLQFCSLIVNFDLPWNPQRIEQRIGRCHRYGQKHDVVVINFINIKNAADVRVYELLDEKFQLFTGVFGASDEVLGAIGNGMDFEKRIAQIYQECRTPDEIKSAFDTLQEELKSQIDERIQTVKTTLLENFDEEVREKLKYNLSETRKHLSRFEDNLWKVTQYYLKDYANFTTDYSFTLTANPFPKELIHAGPYMILKSDDNKRKSDIEIPEDTNIYRIGHKLAQKILTECKNGDTSSREITFDYTNTNTKIAFLEKYIGQSGWLQVKSFSIKSFEDEDYLLLAWFTDDGEIIESEMGTRLFSLNAEVGAEVSPDDDITGTFSEAIHKEKTAIIGLNAERNRDFFDTEIDKLDQWADDMKISLEKEIKDLDAEIKLRKSEAKKTLKLELKVQAQREIKDMEKKRNEKRQNLFEAQDEIDNRKEILLTDIESRLKQSTEEKELFTIKWNLI